MLLLFHVTSLCALAGCSEYPSHSVLPMFRVTVPLSLNVIPAGLYGSTTFTFTLARLFSFAVVTVMVTVPSFSGVTTPSSTVATRVLLLFHVTSLCALAGCSEYPSLSVLPMFRVTVPLSLSVIPAGLYGSTTFTVTLADLPLSVVAVTRAEPSPSARTTPFSTVATRVLLLFQLRLYTASAGAALALSVSVSPAVMSTVPVRLRVSFVGWGVVSTILYL